MVRGKKRERGSFVSTMWKAVLVSRASNLDCKTGELTLQSIFLWTGSTPRKFLWRMITVKSPPETTIAT